jgi:hypothetical protein
VLGQEKNELRDLVLSQLISKCVSRIVPPLSPHALARSSLAWPSVRRTDRLSAFAAVYRLPDKFIYNSRYSTYSKVPGSLAYADCGIDFLEIQSLAVIENARWETIIVPVTAGNFPK